MKKRILALVCLVCLTLTLLASCGKDKETFEQIDLAVSNSSLMSRYERVAYKVTYYDASDTKEEMLYYLDSDGMTIITSKGYTHIDNDGRAFSYNNLTGRYAEIFKVGEGAERFADRYDTVSAFEARARENITKDETNGGIRYITTEAKVVDKNDDLADELGYDEDVASKYIFNYQLDANTNEIIKMEGRLKLRRSEQEVLLVTSEIDKNPEVFKVNSAAYAAINSAEKRTITVVLVNDRGREKDRFSQTFAKGVDVYLFVPDRYDDDTYKDANCEIEMNINADNTSDYLVYIEKE